MWPCLWCKQHNKSWHSRSSCVVRTSWLLMRRWSMHRFGLASELISHPTLAGLCPKGDGRVCVCAGAFQGFCVVCSCINGEDNYHALNTLQKARRDYSAIWLHFFSVFKKKKKAALYFENGREDADLCFPFTELFSPSQTKNFFFFFLALESQHAPVIAIVFV